MQYSMTPRPLLPPPPKKKTGHSRCTASAYGYGFPLDLINKDDVHSANVAIALPYLGSP